MGFERICTAEYKNTTIFVNKMQFEYETTFYYVSIIKNYKSIIDSKTLKILEYVNFDDAITAYKNFVSIIDTF